MAESMLGVTRDAFLALRDTLYREHGFNAAAYLQDAGYTGGPALYDAFSAWLSDHAHPSPDGLDVATFSAHASAFFADNGWGSMSLGALGGGVAAIDSGDWAESDPARPLEYPGCYFSAGFFADFFGRLADAQVAVMEVECRSAGSDRCRFLIGSGEAIQRVYDEMARGVPYETALGTS